MRIFFTSLMAFFLSGFAGALVAQVLAEWTGATEEYILVFFATGLVTMAVTPVFFIAQFFGDATKAVGRTALALLVMFALALVALLGWTFSVPPEQRAQGDFSIIAGLILPGVVTIVVHWLFVRWRIRPRTAEPRFGRGIEPS